MNITTFTNADSSPSAQPVFSPDMLRDCFAGKNHLSYAVLQSKNNVYKIWDQDNAPAEHVIRLMPYHEAEIVYKNTIAAMLMGIPTAEVALQKFCAKDLHPLLGADYKMGRTKPDTIVSCAYIPGNTLHDIKNKKGDHDGYRDLSVQIRSNYYTRAAIAGLADAHDHNIIVTNTGISFIDLEMGAFGDTVHHRADPVKVAIAEAKLNTHQWYKTADYKSAIAKKDMDSMIVSQCDHILEELEQKKQFVSEENAYCLQALFARTKDMACLHRADQRPNARFSFKLI